MKIRFNCAPKGRDYKAGEVVEFKGRIEETYARKYIARGWAAEVDEAAERRERALAAERAKLAARGDIEIPDAYADLPFADLRGLAVKLTDDTIGSKADAVAAIENELRRRSAGQ